MILKKSTCWKKIFRVGYVRRMCEWLKIKIIFRFVHYMNKSIETRVLRIIRFNNFARNKLRLNIVTLKSILNKDRKTCFDYRVLHVLVIFQKNELFLFVCINSCTPWIWKYIRLGEVIIFTRSLFRVPIVSFWK